MRGVWQGVLVWALLGCSAAEGPLLVAVDAALPVSVDAALPSAVDAAVPSGTIDAGSFDSPVRPGMRLQYQLTGAVDEAADAELFVVDLFDTTSAVVGRLHARGRVVAAYLSAGSHEPFRADADAFPAAALGEPLDGYPRERWLDVRDPTVRELMRARIQLAADTGFDGILFSALAAYQVNNGHGLSATDQLDYNLWLAAEAHAQGLAAGLAGDWAQASQLAPAFDFAIHIDCIESGRCAELDPYRALGKAVFDLETSGSAAQVCAQAAAMSLPVTLKPSGWGAELEACP